MSLQEAFSWPAKISDILHSDILPSTKGRPLISSGREITIASNFSGVCTQSRSAAVLQANKIGVTFRHVRRSVGAG